MVTRRRVFLALGASALTAPCALFAQQNNSKISRIAYLSQGSVADHGVFLGAFRDGLREFGWIDGKNYFLV